LGQEEYFLIFFDTRESKIALIHCKKTTRLQKTIGEERRQGTKTKQQKIPIENYPSEDNMYYLDIPNV
jgi:hypothetical protein